MRQANPDHLDHLAELLDGLSGDSGVAVEYANLSTRAAGLNATGHLAPLSALQQWAGDTAFELRDNASILRGGPSALDIAIFGKDVTTTAMAAFYGSKGFWNLVRGGTPLSIPAGNSAVYMANFGAGTPSSGFMARMATRGMSPAMARLLGGSHNAAMYMRAGSGFVPTAQQANLLRLGAAEYSMMRGVRFNAGRLASFRSAAGTVGRAAGVIRSAGVVGSVFGTVTGVADIISQGNPIDAFQRDPSGYAVTVTGTAFNASMTAALVAPNPVTVGAAVVTGVAYAGTLIWDNWDTITNPQTYRDIANAAGDAVSTVGNAVKDGLNSAKNFIGGLFG